MKKCDYCHRELPTSKLAQTGDSSFICADCFYERRDVPKP